MTSKPRPRALRWRQRHVEKVVGRLEKHLDALRFRAWFDGAELTTDWTTGNLTRWRRMLAPWRDAPLRILEVGSWEGRSAMFFLRFFPRATIVCIDAFAQYPETEGRLDRNLAPFGSRVEKRKGETFPVLEQLDAENRRFDLVYIDADHFYEPVMKNSLRAWRLTEPGSVIMWDDYGWGRDHPPEIRAKTAIDEFLGDREGAYRLLAKGYQVAIERLR